MKHRLLILVFAGAACLTYHAAYADIIHDSRAFASVTNGGVDQERDTQSQVDQFSAKVQFTKTTLRANLSLGETGIAILEATAKSGRVGASIEFDLQTSGFNPESNYHLVGAGGIAQARFDDTVSVTFRPYIGLPPVIMQENLDILKDYKQYLVVSNHASYASQVLGDARITEFDLQFSMDVLGVGEESTRLTGPESFKGTSNVSEYKDKTLINAGLSLLDYKNAYESPLDKYAAIPPVTFSLEIYNSFGGISGG